MAKVKLESLSCKSCGAPLKLTRWKTLKGVVTCDYCGQSYSIQDLVQEQAGEPEAADEPLRKPYGSKIELSTSSVPFAKLVIDIPPAGFVKSLPLFIFASFWCGFMVVWNVIALFVAKNIMMFLFGLLHDAVGVFLAIAVLKIWVGREHIEVDSQTFLRVSDLLGFKVSKALPTDQIDRVGVKVSVGSKGGVSKSLVVGAGTQKMNIGGNAGESELDWLSYEIRKFVEEQTGRKVKRL